MKFPVWNLNSKMSVYIQNLLFEFKFKPAHATSNSIDLNEA